MLAAHARLHEVRPGVPHPLRERVVEMHAGDGLHHAAVAQSEPFAVHGLHAPDVRPAVLGDRNAGVAVDDRRHRRRPQQLIAEVLVDELVQVEQVLQQLPGSAEGRRDQLDQRLGIVGGDVLVGERRAQRARMRRLRDAPVGRHAQRFLFDALAAALDDFGLAAVDQRRQGLFELAVDGGTHAGRASCRLPPELRNQSMERGQ